MIPVLQLEEAMGQQLDDHIVMLQSMGFSPYKKPFEDRLAKWDTMLNLVREAQSLTSCQLYLARLVGCVSTAVLQSLCIRDCNMLCM